jgi:hypothetical protein
MHATTFPRPAASGRHTRLIVAAVVAAAALAAAAVLFTPPPRSSWAASSDAQGVTAPVVPVASVGESTVVGDPSVPSAASVFLDRPAAAEAQVDTF